MLKNGKLMIWCSISLEGKYMCSDFLSDDQIQSLQDKGYTIEHV